LQRENDMGEKQLVAVGGENLIDLIVDGDQREAVEGGSPYNVAIALGRQGAETAYISPISQDKWGDGLLARLVASGVRHTGPRLAEPTTMAIATKDGGRVDYTFERDGTAETMVDLASMKQALPSETAAFHVGSLALIGGANADAWVDLCAACRADGRFVSIDPNVRPALLDDAAPYKARIERAVATTDLLKLSDEDLEFLYPDLGFDDAVSAVRAQTSAPLVIVTLGAEGALGFVGDIQVKVPAATPSPFQDAVGAGDTFMATTLATLAARDALSAEALKGLSREDLEAIMTRAAMAAKLNCEQQGCEPPTLGALDAALA